MISISRKSLQMTTPKLPTSVLIEGFHDAIAVCASDQILRPFFAENPVTLLEVGSEGGTGRSVTNGQGKQEEGPGEKGAGGEFGMRLR